LPSSQASALFPLLLAYPGPVLFIAGLFLFRRNNNFLASSFCSFGAVISRAARFSMRQSRLSAAAAPVNLMQGIMFEVFAYISISLLLGAFQMNVVLVLTLLCTAAGFALAGFGFITNAVEVGKFGGYFMLATAAFTFYGGSAVLVNTAWRRVVLPVGVWFERRRPRRRSAWAASRGTAPPTCDPRHCGLRRAVLNPRERAKRAAIRRGFDMTYRQRPRELRLEIKLEAATLISDLGVEAYSVARRRAAEASSDAMARDWTNVALAISRKTRRRPAFPFSMILHGMFSPVERLDAVHPM
jgi:uncharacterized protein